MISNLKIYEVGHWGYAALIPGLGLTIFGLYVAIPVIGGGSWLLGLLLIIPGAALTAKGLREAGKPLIHVSPTSVQCLHRGSRLKIPLKRLEKVIWGDSVLYLHVSKFPDVIRIPMHHVLPERSSLLYDTLDRLQVPQEYEQAAR